MDTKKGTMGIFLGKVLAKQGNSKKDGTPYLQWKCTFKPNEQSPKMFSMSFWQKPAQDGQWAPAFNMIEGQWYTMEYFENPYMSQYGPQVSKTIATVMQGRHPEQIQQYQAQQQPGAWYPQQQSFNQTPQQGYQQPIKQQYNAQQGQYPQQMSLMPPQQPTQINQPFNAPIMQQGLKKIAQDWVKFSEEYDQMVPIGTPDRSARSMLGLYVLNKHQTEFADIITLCKAHFSR